MSKIRSIHDRTFKKLMSDIRVAQDFFQEHLPAEILSLAKLDTLQLSPGTFLDGDLRHKKWSGIMNFMFKHSFERDIWPCVSQMLDMLEAILKEEAEAVTFADQVLKYWILVAELKKQDPREFIQAAQQRLPAPIGEELMTIAEQLKQQGVGLGVKKGESALLMHLLERKLKLKAIPEEYRQRIEKASSKQLMKWAEKVLDCHSLEDVFNSVLA